MSGRDAVRRRSGRTVPSGVVPSGAVPSGRATAPRRSWLQRARPLLALVAALAVLASALPIGLVVDGGDWWGRTIVTIAAMSLAALILRPVHPLLGTLAGAFTLAISITAPAAGLATPTSAVPSADAIGRIAERIAFGIGDLIYFSTPVDVTDRVALGISVAVGLLWIAIDVVVFAARVPAAAGLVMLVPLLLPMGHLMRVPPLVLVPAALVFVALLVLAHPKPVRMRLRGIAASAAIAVLAACLAPAVLPDPQTTELGLPSWLDAPSDGVGLGTAAGTPRLSTGVDLGRDLRRGAPVDVFSYVTSDGAPMITRLTSLPVATDDGFGEAPADLVGDLSDLGAIADGVDVTTDVEIIAAAAESLPIPEQAVAVSDIASPSRGDVGQPDIDPRWDASNQSVALGGRYDLSTVEYAVDAVRLPSLPDDAAGVTSTGHEGERGVPDAADDVAALAGSITDPTAPPLQRARELAASFADGSWTYSENIPFDAFGGGWSSLSDFMDARVGYCVHYATAMAMLARGADLPSRVAIGFLGGTQGADGSYTVTTNDMHAWAEIWLDDYGWVRFDTTPAVAAGASAASSPDDAPAGEPAPAPTPSASAPASDPQPSTEAPASPSATPAPSAGSSADGPDAGAIMAVVGWVLAGLAVILVLAIPWIVRMLQRRRRLRGGARGAWREVQATLADVGRRVDASTTPGELEAAVLRRIGGDDQDAAGALARLRAALEQTVFADVQAEVAVDDVHVVRRALLASLPPVSRVLRRTLPPSVFRVQR